jgi:hypothetical protein
MWFTSNNNIELKLYEMEPFSDEYTVLATYEELDVISLLKSEVNIPDNSMVKVNNMTARKFYLTNRDLDNDATFTSNELTIAMEYYVNYTLIGPTFALSSTDKIEDLPSKIRDIKLNRLI